MDWVTPVNSNEMGAGLSDEYGIDAISFAACDLFEGGTYLGAILVGIVNLTLSSSTGSSETYVIMIFASLLGFKWPSLIWKMSGWVSSRSTAVWLSWMASS